MLRFTIDRKREEALLTRKTIAPHTKKGDIYQLWSIIPPISPLKIWFPTLNQLLQQVETAISVMNGMLFLICKEAIFLQG